MIGVDARASREIQAVLLALAQTDREIVKRVNAESRSEITPMWKDAVQANSYSHIDHILFGATAKSLVSASQVKLRTASTVPRALAAVDARAFEFGANRNATSTYTGRSSKGKSYQVTRHTRHQLPWKRKAGPTYKAVEEVMPRILALWVQTSVRVLFEAFEAKRG